MACWIRNGVERIELTGHQMHYDFIPRAEVVSSNADPYRRGSKGSVRVRAERLEPGVWWIELVRVGDPNMRGQGLGTHALRRAVTVLFALVGAHTIGLRPHALGHRHDLRGWYRRMGFAGDEDAMWMRGFP